MPIQVKPEEMTRLIILNRVWANGVQEQFQITQENEHLLEPKRNPANVLAVSYTTALELVVVIRGEDTPILLTSDILEESPLYLVDAVLLTVKEIRARGYSKLADQMQADDIQEAYLFTNGQAYVNRKVRAVEIIASADMAPAAEMPESDESDESDDE